MGKWGILLGSAELKMDKEVIEGDLDLAHAHMTVIEGIDIETEVAAMMIPPDIKNKEGIDQGQEKRGRRRKLKSINIDIDPHLCLNHDYFIYCEILSSSFCFKIIFYQDISFRDSYR